MWQSIFRLFPLLFLSSAADYINLCHEISGGQAEDFKNWKNCTFDQKIDAYGNWKDAVVLDFSQATEKEIYEFFSKSENNTATLQAGLALIDNNHVETLNLSNIDIWEAVDLQIYVNFLHIRGNAQLKRIIWPKGGLSSKEKQRILIYNNPLLKLEENNRTMLEKVMDENSYLQADNVCIFEDMTDPPETCPKSKPPSQELLDNCRIIDGSLFLNNMTLPKDLQLIGSGCIALYNVTFSGYRLDAENHTTISGCLCHRNSQTLRENPNLCGDNLTELYNHMENGPYSVYIQLDPNTCTRNCTAEEALNPYFLCSEIVEDVDISDWFREEDEKYKAKMKQQQLVAVKGILSIKDLSKHMIELKYLTEVTGLHLTGNHLLHTINFPLTSVQQLIVTNNQNLPFDQFPLAFGRNLTKFPNMDKSTTECLTNTRNSRIVWDERDHILPITNFEMIRLCTRIIGHLKLVNIPGDSDVQLFKIREIEGCITVENTQLTGLFFLENIKILDEKCYEGHKIINNPQLCSRGVLEGHKVIRENNKPDSDCPCIQSDVVRPASGSATAANCPKTILSKDFSCDEFDPTTLVEVHGTLRLINCTNLEAKFANLKKIISGKEAVPLYVDSSSEAPSLEFLKRIEFLSEGGDGAQRFIEIHSQMSVEQYLRIKYTYGPLATVRPPHLEPYQCYYLIEDGSQSSYSCQKFEGDFVVENDEPLTYDWIREITGCLIVKNGTHLDYLKKLKRVGKLCKYGKYPQSPSFGFEETTIGPMQREFCPSREERERLAPILNSTSIRLSGKEPECGKACTNLTEGNCDSLFGDLTVTPDVYLGNLEIIHGKLSIIGSKFEELNFPKLKRISSQTAPALIIERNDELRLLKMPKKPRITAADGGRPLIKITENPKLKRDSLNGNLPNSRECINNSKARCYLDNSGETREKYADVLGWKLALPLLLISIFVIPIATYFLYQRKRQKVLEKLAKKRGKEPKIPIDRTQTKEGWSIMSELSSTAIGQPPNLIHDFLDSAPSLKGESPPAASKRSSRIRVGTRTGSKTSSSRTGSPQTPTSPAGKSVEQAATPASNISPSRGNNDKL